MTIEVISRRHPSATKTVICYNCGAELRYTNSDTRRQIVSGYTGNKETYTYLDCPACGNPINVGIILE